MNDNVKSPSHYCKGGIECIDAIKAVVSTIADPFEAYCTGNIIKYIWRWNDKNGVEDLRKAVQYIEFIEQYRADKPTAEDSSEDEIDFGEEDVSESDEGKWAGMSDFVLENLMCKEFAGVCKKCLLYNDGYTCRFPGWRAIAIKHLREKER